MTLVISGQIFSPKNRTVTNDPPRAFGGILHKQCATAQKQTTNGIYTIG